MAFELRYEGQRIHLPDGDFTIGRSAACDLVIVDALASRKHAVLHVAADRVELEDAGSRNGIQHRGRLLAGRVELADGDTFHIGDRELELVLVQPRTETITTSVEWEGRPTQAGPGPVDARQMSETGLSRPDALLLAEAKAAIASGDVGEAAGGAYLLCRRLINAAKGGGPGDREMLDGTTKLLADITTALNEWSWAERTFELCRVHRHVLSGPVIDALSAVARDLSPRSERFAPYYRTMVEAQDDLTVEQRVRVRRLEALGRALQSGGC